MNFAQITSLLELAANVTLTAIPETTALVPLISGIEAGINPLISNIMSGSSKTSDVLAGYGALIAIIKTLKAKTGIAPDVLAKLDVYLAAAQDGTTEALAVVVKGYDPTQFTLIAPGA